MLYFLDLNVASPSSPNMNDHYSAGKSSYLKQKHGECAIVQYKVMTFDKTNRWYTDRFPC